MMRARLLTRMFDSGALTMLLTCLLGIASYFFGQPMAIELHWFWMALMSLTIVAMAVIQFVLSRRNRRRDELLYAILNAVPHGLFFKDAAFRYRLVNTDFERTFEIAEGAAIGKSTEELFGSVLSERRGLQDRELASSRKVLTYDEDVTIQGEVRSFQVRKSPVLDRKGRLRGIVGVVMEVTQEKRMRQEIESALERLNIALEAARMGTWEWNLTTGELCADERARQILGIKDAVCDQSVAFARLHPNDTNKMMRCVKKGRPHKETITYEGRVIDDSGAMRWVEGFSSPSRPSAGCEVVVGVCRDITERYLNDRALAKAKLRADRSLSERKQAQANLAMALNVGELGVWHSVTRLHKDRDGPSFALDVALRNTLIVADTKIREIYGYTAAEFRYRDVAQLLHPQDRERAAQVVLQACRAGQGAYRDQFRICRHDGQVRTVAIRGSVTTRSDSSGQVLLTITGIAKDITREEALKADLVTKAEEAREALDAKRQFLAMMSHEVRTPLVGILGMVDLLLDTPVTDPQHGMLMRLRESALLLLVIINNILDFSKIEAHKLKLEHRRMSLIGLIDDVKEALMPEARRKSITFEVRVDPRLPEFIRGDSFRLRQILMNLVGNAIKFTSQGGVKLIAQEAQAGFLELVVEDTGIGIEPSVIESLFQPFQQADVATTRRYGGTGLGLAIVRQLVELMNGRVRCDSEPGRGSRFMVKLPLEAWRLDPDAAVESGPAPFVRRAADESLAIGRGRRLLFAEDQRLNHEVIMMQLSKLGFECDGAEDGEQAWEMLNAPGADYALLLTDCHMPRLDGCDLTRRVRAQEAERGGPRLPIVVLTASALPEEAERGYALGIDAYLVKPLELHALAKGLADVLDRQGLQSPAKQQDAYPSLMALAGGNAVEVCRLIDIFVATSQSDLEAMDRAAEQGDGVRLRQLAHRFCSACQQLDETPAVAAMRALETALAQAPAGEIEFDVSTQALFETARNELLAVLARTADFIRAHRPSP